MGLYDNLIKDLSDMGKSASTLYGYVSREGLNQYHKLQKDIKEQGQKQAILNAFKNTISNPTVKNVVTGAGIGAGVGSMVPVLGTIPGAIAGGMIGGMGGRNYINAALSPYNLSIDKTYTPKEIISNISKGAYEHPATATLDFLSLGGSRLLSPLAKGLGESVGIIPSQKEKLLFRDLTEALNTQRTGTAKQYAPVTTLQTKPLLNRTDMVKYITHNEAGSLKKNDIKLGNKIKKSLKEAEKVAIENKWITQKEARDNTISQYIMGIYGKDNPDLLHYDIMDYLSGNKKNNKITKNIKEDIVKASKLYDDNKINYLTQAIVNSYDPTGTIVARDINAGAKNYFENRRIIGRSMAEDIGRKLDQSLEFQLDKVYKAKEAQQISTDILTQYGRAVKDGDVIKANEVIVSPIEIKKIIAKSFIDNNSQPITEYLRRVGKTGKGIAIDKKYLNAVANALQDTSKVPFSRATGIIKRTLLAQPHWIALNRIGNASNNMIEGVGISDYIDALKYRNLTPNQLKNQTSFNHFLTETGKGQTILDSSKAGLTKLINTISNFNPNDTKSYKRLALGILEGTNEIVTEPAFKIESTLELLDRYANFVRQAKRYGEARGIDFRDVIKRSRTDTKLYNKLNNKVNKSLGDYIGRNYNISPNAYQYLSMVVPFYRFISQTGRTTANQLTNKGLAFQSIVQQPEKIGSSKREEIINALGISPEDFVGGVPYKISGTDIKGRPTKFRMIAGEPLPAHTITSEIADLLSGNIGQGIVSPIYTTASELVQGTKYGRPIKTPYKEALSALGLPYDMVEQVKLSPKERWKYIANTLAGYASSPYRLSTTYIPEAIAAIKKNSLKSRFETDPYLEIPSSYPRSGLTELIGKWFGIQNKDQYLPYTRKITGRDISKNIRKYRNKVK